MSDPHEGRHPARFRLDRFQAYLDESPKSLLLAQAEHAVQGLLQPNEKKGEPRLPIRDVLELIAYRLGYQVEVRTSVRTEA